MHALRPSGGTALAASRHLPVPHDFARSAAAQRLPRTWSASRAAAVGRAGQPLHRAVRGPGRRLVARSQPERRRRVARVELGRSSRHPGARGAPRTGAPASRARAASGRRREKLPQAASLSDGGQRSGSRTGVVRGRGPQANKPGRLLGDVDAGATAIDRSGGDGHVGSSGIPMSPRRGSTWKKRTKRSFTTNSTSRSTWPRRSIRCAAPRTSSCGQPAMSG